MEYVNSMNRQAMLYIRNINPNLQAINYDNNNLTYGDAHIELGNFNLMTLLGDYNSFKSDLNLISCEDFMNIVGIHVLGTKQLDSEKPTIREVFYKLLDGIPVKYDTDKVVNGYNSFLYDLMCHQDYLTPEIQPLLNEFKIKMEDVAVFEEQVTDLAKQELSKYYIMQEKAKEYALRFQKDKQKKLELTIPREKAGYINSFIVIVITMITGILLASLIFINFW